MTLADYVNELKGEHSLRDITGPRRSGVSRGALHQILTGATTAPSPKTLENLARWFGKTEDEQRIHYATMMELAGYIEFLPLGVELSEGAILAQLPARVRAFVEQVGREDRAEYVTMIDELKRLLSRPRRAGTVQDR